MQLNEVTDNEINIQNQLDIILEKLDALKSKSKEQSLKDLDQWLIRNTKNNILPLGGTL